MAEKKKVLMKGNEALAEAALRAGCKFYFGYPITPQTEIGAYLSKAMPKMGRTFLQAESEVAAINMVYGASACGARAMTSSSSPGISLKAEGMSYLAGADLPAVVINVQRGGPGLGSIQPSQADYFQAVKGMGHGDYHVITFAPCTVQEMSDFTYIAFDLADKYRATVMILADGMLGQMMEPVVLPERKTDYDMPEKPWAVTGSECKREHNVVNSLYLDTIGLHHSINAREKRYEDACEKCQYSQSYHMDNAEIVVVAYGASARVCINAVNEARKKGIKAGLLRPISLWPFPTKDLEKLIKNTKEFLCVEMNTGQMVEDLERFVCGRIPVTFYGVAGGLIPQPEDLLEQIEKLAVKGGK
ncbi:MAG: 3-methyl-2-oxobutanoate dehydrogenase subunit VorB [Eggerthellaceae bacterium]|nr:3-methyl-2-oxobutanoate dehydrogenase subunit VorB [Eggerthellaceae bacterium]